MSPTDRSASARSDESQQKQARPSDEEIRRVWAWEQAERARKQREHTAKKEEEERVARERAVRETDALLVGKRIADWDIGPDEFTLTLEDGSTVIIEWDEDAHSFYWPKRS